MYIQIQLYNNVTCACRYASKCHAKDPLDNSLYRAAEARHPCMLYRNLGSLARSSANLHLLSPFALLVVHLHLAKSIDGDRYIISYERTRVLHYSYIYILYIKYIYGYQYII